MAQSKHCRERLQGRGDDNSCTALLSQSDVECSLVTAWGVA